MTEEFRVPKHRIPARVVVVGEPPRDVELFLSERAARHTGGERPGDLLNEGEPFFAVRDPNADRTLLLHRASVAVLSFRARDGSVDEPATAEEIAESTVSAEGVTRRRVRIRLEGGTEVAGTLTYAMPAGERRVRDFLNQAKRFVAVRDDDRIQLVNTRRILQVEME